MAEHLSLKTAPAHLVVCFKPSINIRSDTQSRLVSSSHDVTSIAECLKKYDARCELLFGPTPERVQKRQADTLKTATSGDLYEDYKHPLTNLPDLSCFYRVHCTDDKSEQLISELAKQEHVDGVYYKPETHLPIAFVPSGNATFIAAATTTTPDYQSRQIYLNPAPAGIDAKISWIHPGGRGAGTKIIDCENGWNLNHEDLLDNQGGLVSGTSSSEVSMVDHGTAVFGEISGDKNSFGITGIASDSVISACSWNGIATSTAIRNAADKLSAGDIILLEGHRQGPRTSRERTQLGFLPIEWWPDDLLAVRYAVGKGIIVVAAAGNGDEDLENPFYDNPPRNQVFPSWWRNPLNRNNQPSGSIMVGAGQPPPGTHDRQTLADRSRCHYDNWWGSNYSNQIDSQGWGVEVTTSGYQKLNTGDDQNLWYTDEFSGTSSASPIVVGALLCVQGILKARGRRPLTPLEAKLLLRNCGGTGQQPDTNTPVIQRIGKRPNLRKLIPSAARWKTRSAKYDSSGQASIFVANSSKVGLLRQNGSVMGATFVIPNGTMLAGGWRINAEDNIFGPVGLFTNVSFAESLVVSLWGIGIIRGSTGTFEAMAAVPNGTRLGNWLLNTNDNSFGPAGKFGGNSMAEIIVTSPWGLGILQASGGTFRPIAMAPNGTRFGDWLLNTNDNDFSCVGSFRAPGRAKTQILAVSPWGIGVLDYNASTGSFDAVDMRPNGTRLGDWLLNTADNRFGPVADFDGDGIDEVLVTSPWGVGLLKLTGGKTLNVVMAKPNGTRFGDWLLNTNDNSFGPAADFNGDGRAELLVTSPWGAGALRYDGASNHFYTLAIHANGSRLGNWLLNTENDTLGQAADFDGDGKAEILATSGWGFGILKFRDGAGFVSSAMAQNGSAAFSWKVDSAADDYGDGW